MLCGSDEGGAPIGEARLLGDLRHRVGTLESPNAAAGLALIGA